MIAKARNKKAKVSFELGTIEKTVASGTTVTVYIQNSFNPTYFISSINPITGVTIAKVNSNTFNLTPTITASFPIVVNMENDVTGNVTKSNRIVLIST